MKKKLFFGCLVFSCILHSQTILTQSFNEPVPGDLESRYGLDTSSFTGGMPVNITGTNVVWDFTGLQANSPVLDAYYLSAASATTSANYPGCNLVQESDGVYTYFKSVTSPTTQTELLGIETSTVSVNLTNSGIIAKYPISYGSSSSDNMSGTFSFSVQGTCSGSIATTADGEGTLNLPGGISLTHVLRVKSVQTLTLTAFFTQVGVLKQTIYNYYKPAQKFPVLSITYAHLSSPLLSEPSVTGFASGSRGYFVTGIKETSLNENNVALYPNPAQSTLTVALRGNLLLTHVTVYNALGQVAIKTTEAAVDLQSLDSGIYTVEISTDKGTIRKKIVKE